MATIRTFPFLNSTILRINSEYDVININPEYQRKGGVWTRQKKQLLIDSILNDYDIPKLYFHYYNTEQKRKVAAYMIMQLLTDVKELKRYGNLLMVIFRLATILNI